jgi:hypothetical protein
MINIAFEGGLGNQMFQYAMGRYVQMKFKEPVTYDVSRYVCENDEIRNFELLNFNIDKSWTQAPIVKNRTERFGISYLLYCALTWAFVKYNGNRYLNYKPVHGSRLYSALINRLGFYRVHFNDHVEPRRYGWTKTIHIRGMWFWMDLMRRMKPYMQEELRVVTPLSESNARFLRQIESTNSVGVHIRRGDYVKLGLIVCDIQNYYARCIERMNREEQDAVFYIFSDDIPWVKENLKVSDDCRLVFIDNKNSSPDDMRLLQHCNHFIMSNSTFSWWGAFLGTHPNKKVFVPKYWTERPHQSLFVLDEWTPINNHE